MIIPRFAAPPVRRAELGIYHYLGSKRWQEVPQALRRQFVYVGIWG